MAKIQGLQHLHARLARLPAQMKAAVRPAIDIGADELVAMQKRLVEYESGDLQRSIRKEAGPTELSVIVTAGGPLTTKPVRQGADSSYDYALANEFGTQNMTARPFFYPSYRALRKRIRSRISRAVGKAVRAG